MMKDTDSEFEAAGKPSEGGIQGDDIAIEEGQGYDPGTTYRRPDESRDSNSNRRSNVATEAPRSEGLRRWNIDQRCYETLHDGVWQRDITETETPSLIGAMYPQKSTLASRQRVADEVRQRFWKR